MTTRAIEQSAPSTQAATDATLAAEYTARCGDDAGDVAQSASGAAVDMYNRPQVYRNTVTPRGYPNIVHRIDNQGQPWR
jgi:hypothetical protein